MQETTESRPGNESQNGHNGRSVKGTALGLIRLGLGVAQVAAPQALAVGLGLKKRGNGRRIMRLIGAREILSGLGNLGRRRGRAWGWARIAGDVMDLAMLAAAIGSAKKLRRGRLPLALVAVAGVTVIDVLSARRAGKQNAMVAAQ